MHQAVYWVSYASEESWRFLQSWYIKILFSHFSQLPGQLCIDSFSPEILRRVRRIC